MSTDTTTTPASPIPAPPAGWHTGPDREKIAARRIPGGQMPERSAAPDEYHVPTDSADVARVYARFQNGSRRAERDGIQRSSRDGRVLRILDAANALAAVSADDPDDEIGRAALQLVHDLRELAARFVTVPAPSRIRPDVPGTEAA